MRPCPLCADGAAPSLVTAAGRLLSCRGCGTLFQETPPTPEELSAIYADGYFDGWGLGADPEPVERMKRRTFRDLLSLLEKHAVPGRLLDVGCATGFLMAEAESRGWTAHGVEFNRAAAEAAGRRFPGRVRAGGWEDYPRPAVPFDAVAWVDVFEHFVDPAAALRKLSEVLAPGGHLLVVVPEGGCLSQRLWGRRWPHFSREHILYPTRRGLERGFSAAGLTMREARPAFKSFTPGYLASQLRRRTGAVAALARWAERLLPEPILKTSFRLPSGQVAAVFRRGE